MIEASSSAAGERPLPPGEVRAQLSRILKSAEFEATPREHRFLGYVVDQTLSGRAARIKAYSIAVEVFGRDGSFDPQSDPIVRIEASHLRRSLERYYLTAGLTDKIRISIPKGGYVPTFSPNSAAVAEPKPVTTAAAQETPLPRRLIFLAAAALVCALCAGLVLAAPWRAIQPRVSAPEVPRLLVEPLESITNAGETPAIARGLSQEIIGQLSKFRDLVVVEAEPSRRVGEEKITDLPRYVLMGSVELTADQFMVRVRVLNRSDGAVLWANSYGGGTNVPDVLKAETDIAAKVATSLAQVYGVIFQADLARRVDNPPDDWEAYACTLSYYAYRAKLDRTSHASVRHCLEKAVENFPNYATAWGLLSQTYIDEIRFRYPIEPGASPASIERALNAAKRAVDLDPLNVRGMQALMFALYFNRETDAAMKVGAQALAANPNDTELIGEYGFRLATSGNWKEGCPLIVEARNRNPGPLSYYEAALGLCAYFSGDFHTAATWMQKISPIDNPNYHVMAAAIYAEAGLNERAAQEVKWVLENEPQIVKRMRPELEMRFYRPHDVDVFLASLRKSGLAVGN